MHETRFRINLNCYTYTCNWSSVHNNFSPNNNTCIYRPTWNKWPWDFISQRLKARLIDISHTNSIQKTNTNKKIQIQLKDKYCSESTGFLQIEQSVTQTWVGSSSEVLSNKVRQAMSIVRRGRHTDGAGPVEVEVAQDVGQALQNIGGQGHTIADILEVVVDLVVVSRSHSTLACRLKINGNFMKRRKRQRKYPKIKNN